MYKYILIYNLGAKGYVIDTRTSAGITSSKVKGGGIEDPLCYPRWKRINRPKDSGPTRYYYLLDSFSKVSFLLFISTSFIVRSPCFDILNSDEYFCISVNGGLHRRQWRSSSVKQ